MNDNKPKVSAVIVTYNRPNFVGDAIQSVLNQSFKDFELIIVDNGVEIPAKEIVESFSDSRIRYIQNNKNTGCAGGKNVGMRNMSGEFVAFLDDDDVWFPDKLELQIKAFEKNPEAGFCFTAVTQVFDHGARDSKVPEGIGNYYEKALQKFNLFLAVTLMIKKEVLDDIGLIDETLPSCDEAELMIRISKKYKGVGINKPLVKVMSLSSHQQMGRSYQIKIDSRKIVFKRYEEEYKKRPNVFANHLFILAQAYRNNGQYKEAGDTFKKSYEFNSQFKTFIHYLSMYFSGFGYKLFRILKRMPYPKNKS